MSKDRTAFMGVPVDAITMQETIRRIHNSIEQGDKIQHMAINTMIILRMVEDPEFMHTLSKCEVINADGIGVVWASKLLGHPLPQRVHRDRFDGSAYWSCSPARVQTVFLGCSRRGGPKDRITLPTKNIQTRTLLAIATDISKMLMNNRLPRIFETLVRICSLLQFLVRRKRFSWGVGERR